MKKTIVVTGGAGFIGSHLCEALQEQGHTVISLDNYFTGSRDNHIDGVDYREGHTKDIAKYITEKIDLVYHLGEYSRTAVAMDEPNVVFDLNLTGTTGVLEFCRAQNCKLVYAGSSTKFSKTRPEGIIGTELSPYTWSKSTNTELIKNYNTWYGLDYATVYFYNVYGPRELSGHYGTVIEIFKQQYLKNTPLTVNKPGTQLRRYTHVLDTVAALLLVGDQGQGDNYGIGSDEELATKDLAELFNTEINMKPERKTSRPAASIDATKLKDLGWKTKYNIKDYIKDFLQANPR